MLRLRYTKSDGSEVVHDLETLPAVLGRHPRATVVIDNPGVSREHARIFERGGAVLLADLHSSNGTYVNGKKVSRAELKPGDEIRLGRAQLAVEEKLPEDRADAAEGPEIFEMDDAPEAADPAVQPEPSPRPAPAPRSAPDSRTERPVQQARPAPPPTAAPRTGGGVQVKDGLLQYHKIPAGKKASLLHSEFIQHHPLFRVAAIVIMIALAVGIFFVFKWLTEKTVPAPWEANPDSIESEMDEDF